MKKLIIVVGALVAMLGLPHVGIAADASTARPGAAPARKASPPRPAAAGDVVITFDDFATYTPISDQYQPQGIVFGGDQPFVSIDGANPTSPVLSGSPQFRGAIEGRFVDPGGSPRTVNHFSLDAGYFDDIESTRLTWYSGSGAVIGSALNEGLGIYRFDVQGAGIARWRIEIVSEEGAGYAIDNVAFSSEDEPGSWHSAVSLGGAGGLLSYPDCHPDAAGIGCWFRYAPGVLGVNDGPPVGGRALSQVGGSVGGPPRCLVRVGAIDCFVATASNQLGWWHGRNTVSGTWRSLGGNASGQPACLAAQSGGKIDCYASGTDRAVRHWAYNGKTWAAAVKIAGTSSFSRVTCAPHNGTDCFYIDAKGTAYTFHVAANGKATKPQKLVGGFGLPPSCINSSDGKLDCFGQSSKHTLLKGFFDGKQWKKWNDLGGDVVSDAECYQTGGGPNPDFDCFWTNGAGHMIERQRLNAVWQNEADRGGSLQQKPSCVIGVNKACFARGKDNNLYELNNY